MLNVCPVTEQMFSTLLPEGAQHLALADLLIPIFEKL